MERKNARQRRDMNSTLGFNRYGLIPEEDTPYKPPQHWPEDAKDYLIGLSRCGTMSGACTLAGISANRIYQLRKEIGLDFNDEEDLAKEILTDVLEQSLYECGLGAVDGAARVRALESALKANRPDKYDRAQKHEIDGEVKMSWLDLLKKYDKEEKADA